MAVDTKRLLNHPPKDVSRKPNYFPWSKLSGELRNEIYTYTLTHDEPIRITGVLNPWDEAEYVLENKRLPNINLIYINKTTYTEAVPLLYELNTFYFSGTLTLDLFMAALPEKLMSHLRHLIIANGHNYIGSDKAFLPLIKAPNLTRVELDNVRSGQAFYDDQFLHFRMHVRPPPLLGCLSKSVATQPHPGNPSQQLLGARLQATRPASPPLRRVKLAPRAPLRSICQHLASLDLTLWLDDLVEHMYGLSGFRRWMHAIGDAKGDPGAGAGVVCLSQRLLDERQACGARLKMRVGPADEAPEFRALLEDWLVYCPESRDE
ncbi:Short-chain dehydrogenase reductase sdr protein [Lasiodiplodia theobromae]|uniref:Short-chain dehydrogenase reductase sdr protein n=1 Tax=Lasiodiplodia theobromae TaxID=45133 RepID=UPI0015C37499|nr:Short-chain dehydrogenase reductase sdr protein [Lasiodiplodia theobromae]KAF4536386.1 Short-chain dehydrogenase reductase sdr protein [Lasiodiplodia theobromae]